MRAVWPFVILSSAAAAAAVVVLLPEIGAHGDVQQCLEAVGVAAPDGYIACQLKTGQVIFHRSSKQ